jgi:hypothetical protein
VLSGKPFELGPVKLTCSKHGRSLNHGNTSSNMSYAFNWRFNIYSLLRINDLLRLAVC